MALRGLARAPTARRRPPGVAARAPAAATAPATHIAPAGKLGGGAARGDRAVAAAAADAALAPPAGATPVPKNSMLVIGGTGTLGRQIVRRALDEGYDVRCIVRPRMNPADFLRDWGATTVQADLKDPASLPAAMVGVHTVVDCATARPEESTQEIDWDGKVALIQAAQAVGVQRYVFFSIHNAEKHPQVPLMQVKAATEKFLEASGLNYTTFRLCGFMQVSTGTRGCVAPAAALWRVFGGVQGPLQRGPTGPPTPSSSLLCPGPRRQLRRPHPRRQDGVGHDRRDAHGVP